MNVHRGCLPIFRRQLPRTKPPKTFIDFQRDTNNFVSIHELTHPIESYILLLAKYIDGQNIFTFAPRPKHTHF